MSLRFLCLALLVLAAPSGAAQAPDVLWTVDLHAYASMSQPHVGPDGTIYIVTNRLYAIAPDGTVRWTAPAYESYVDVGPDGTVYTSAANTVFAYNPDGSLRWSFTEEPAGQGIMVGPTVGPDGNLYAASDIGGLGAFSLTPEGQLRWSLPGFRNSAGTGQGRVQFGPGRFYFAEDSTPGCGSLDGLTAVTLDGSLAWCVTLSGAARPISTPGGDAALWSTIGPSIRLYAPDGSTRWTFTFPWASTGVGAAAAGTDGTIYAIHGTNDLFAIAPNGTQRWATMDVPGLSVPQQPIPSPDDRRLIVGQSYAYGENGAVYAFDAASGALEWQLSVPGPSAGVGAPAAFAIDGSVVYVPVSTGSFDVPDQLWAIRLHSSAATPAEATLDGARFDLGAAAPHPVARTATLTLALDRARAVRVEVFDALGRSVAVLLNGAAEAGEHRLTFDASALPAGVYVVRAEAGGTAATARVVVAR